MKPRSVMPAAVLLLSGLASAQRPPRLQTAKILSCGGNIPDAVLLPSVCVQDRPGGDDPCFANVLKNVVVRKKNGETAELDYLALASDETGDSLLALMMAFIPDEATRSKLRASYFISSIEPGDLEYVEAPAEAVLKSKAPGRTIAVGRLTLALVYDVAAMRRAGLPEREVLPRTDMILGDAADLSKVPARNP